MYGSASARVWAVAHPASASGISALVSASLSMGGAHSGNHFRGPWVTAIGRSFHGAGRPASEPRGRSGSWRARLGRGRMPDLQRLRAHRGRTVPDLWRVGAHRGRDRRRMRRVRASSYFDRIGPRLALWGMVIALVAILNYCV